MAGSSQVAMISFLPISQILTQFGSGTYCAYMALTNSLEGYFLCDLRKDQTTSEMPNRPLELLVLYGVNGDPRRI